MKIQKITIIFLFLLALVSCKTKKESEFKDDKWREESQKIASDICEKLKNCAGDVLSRIKPSLQKYAESELRSDKCTEKNKKSRVYLLKGYDPKLIQENVRDCYMKIMKLSCDEIREDKISNIESCMIMEKIQKGIQI
ncbi:MAG: hypothetical protein L6Q54_12155 [Leptospiraceae bacterium]|nr:hypothetical protein [Leptospiraceae bacterium]MCK6381984.1 hypothetical protein [Leptospiraceae bacterium]